MQIGFPAEVIDIVNTLGSPSWDLIQEAIEKLLKENRLEQAIQDLERLMDDEDSFQWAFMRSPLLFWRSGYSENLTSSFSPTCP
jgi:hypothetical protein